MAIRIGGASRGAGVGCDRSVVAGRSGLSCWLVLRRRRRTMKNGVVVLLITLCEKLRGKQDEERGEGENSAERDHDPDLL